MELIRLERSDQAVNPELRQRVERVGYREYTRHFVAREDGQEVAYVAIDLHPPGEFWLYDLRVPKDMRRNHVGTRVLQAVESLAREFGRTAVNLHPKSLDKDFPDEELFEWYRRCGYLTVKGYASVTLSKPL